MNKSLIFRMLGALSSALIVVAVFLPFFMVDGYSESLWYSGGQANALFLPILIIIFGMIGVIFFSLNFKTEFAYASCGAIIFYVIMTTIDYLNQNKFDTLSIGYYFLLIGAILTGIMAFITNKKAKIKVIAPINETPKEQMNLNNVNMPISENNNMVPIQPIQNNDMALSISEIPQEQTINQIPDIQPIQSNTLNSNIPQQNIVLEQFNTGMPSMSVSEPVQVQQNPVLEQFNAGMPSMSVAEPVQVQQNPVLEQFNAGMLSMPVTEPVQDQPNPVLEQFNAGMPSMSVAEPVQDQPNPVLEQFNAGMPSMPVTEPVQVQPNPVLEQFNAGMPSMPVTEPVQVQQNPVLEQFNTGMPSEPPVETSQSLFSFGDNNIQPVQENFGQLSQTQNTNSLDIFGQPINK